MQQNLGDPIGHLLVHSCSVLTVNGHVHKPWREKNMIFKGLEPLGMEVWVATVYQLLRLAEVRTEDEGNLEQQRREKESIICAFHTNSSCSLFQ